MIFFLRLQFGILDGYRKPIKKLRTFKKNAPVYCITIGCVLIVFFGTIFFISALMSYMQNEYLFNTSIRLHKENTRNLMKNISKKLNNIKRQEIITFFSAQNIDNSQEDIFTVHKEISLIFSQQIEKIDEYLTDKFGLTVNFLNDE